MRRFSVLDSQAATRALPVGFDRTDPRWRLWLATLPIPPDEELLGYLALFDADEDDSNQDPPRHPFIGMRPRLVTRREGLVLPKTFVASPIARPSGLVMPGGRSSAYLPLNAREQGRTGRPIIVRSSSPGLVEARLAPVLQFAAPIVVLAEHGSAAHVNAHAASVVADRSMRMRGDPAAARRSGKRKLRAVAALAALVVLSALGLARPLLFGSHGGVPAQLPVQASIAPSQAGPAATSAVPAPAGETERPRPVAGNSTIRELSDDVIAERTGSIEPRAKPIEAGAVVPVLSDEAGGTLPVREVKSTVPDAGPSVVRSGSVKEAAATPEPERPAIATVMPERKPADPGPKRKARKTVSSRKPAKVALDDRPRAVLVLPDALKPH